MLRADVLQDLTIRARVLRAGAIPWLTTAALAFASLTNAAPAIAQAGSAPPSPPQETQQQETISVPLPAGTKLVLKDGSFHLVRSYEVKGERVRYWSVERSAWEEIPTELVDWEATHKGEAEDEARRKEINAKIKELEAKKVAGEVDADASLEVAPGVFLPDGIGLFIVQGNEVVPMTQAEAQSKLNKKKFLAQVMVPIPVIPTERRVELPGPRAALRIATGKPEFYFRTAEAREPQIELLRVRVKGNKREVGAVQTWITGQSTERHSDIAVERWTVARGVYRFTLSQKLEPGEYAFAENVPDQGMNLYLWDFGVDSPGSDSTPKKP